MNSYYRNLFCIKLCLYCSCITERHREPVFHKFVTFRAHLQSMQSVCDEVRYYVVRAQVHLWVLSAHRSANQWYAHLIIGFWCLGWAVGPSKARQLIACFNRFDHRLVLLQSMCSWSPYVGFWPTITSLLPQCTAILLKYYCNTTAYN